MAELRECPFCGGEAEYYSDCDMVKVRCSACGANTSGWWDEPEEAAADWNRRPVPENKAMTLDTIRKRLHGLSYESSEWSAGGEHPRVVELDEIDELFDELDEPEEDAK